MSRYDTSSTTDTGPASPAGCSCFPRSTSLEGLNSACSNWMPFSPVPPCPPPIVSVLISVPEVSPFDTSPFAPRAPAEVSGRAASPGRAEVAASGTVDLKEMLVGGMIGTARLTIGGGMSPLDLGKIPMTSADKSQSL